LNHLNHIFKKLNLTKENGLYIAGEHRKNLFSNRVERLLLRTIKPDAFFCIDNKPFILFFENLGESKTSKLKDIWNFNESPIVIISEKDSVEIYNGFKYLTDKNALELFGKEERLSDFSYFELVTGKTWERHQKDFDSTNRIDYHLLNNIKSARDILLSKLLSSELTNSLIGKVIFVRYLIDREIKLDFENKGQSRVWSNSDFCSLLSNKTKVSDFFSYLKEKFNGDLFPITKNEIEEIPKDCLDILVDLLSGDIIGSGQRSLFDLYDFSIIPVEFISNVYELFIGQDQQEKNGAYYTPLFLVDYVLAETVEKRLTYQNDAICKVLDPACGSGIFLVETLRKIIEKYQRNNPEYFLNPDKYQIDLKKIASDNIFGVDKDSSAINVAIFSIYLILLDYQKPSDIEAFRFPVLLNNNFFISDFFDTNAEFNDVFKRIDFDFILGNPPWKRGKGEKGIPLFDKYINGRRKKELGHSEIKIEISNKEIAQAFVLRTSDFSSSKTKISLVVTSKLLYNINAKKFRSYLLDNFLINKVLELSPVRKEIFNNSNDKAVAPASVLFFQHASNQETDNNIVEHITLKPSRFFSMFKVFTIQRDDYKTVSQKNLKDHDYLWKVLVYGNYLDFNLLKRLKQSYPTIDSLISDEDRFVFGQGIQKGGGDTNDASQHIGKTYVNARRDIEAFWVNTKTTSKWEHNIVHRQKVDELFKSPMLLISKGFKTTFRCASAYSNNDVVFTDAITSIHAIKRTDSENLKGISSILNSSLFAYINLQTFSSSGIEREQAHNEEKFGLPFVINDNIVNIYNDISRLKLKQHSINTLLDVNIAEQIDNKISELDLAVISSFALSEQEKDLLDYSVNITIPMLMKHRGHQSIFNSLDSKSDVISQYAQLFFNRFNSAYNKIGEKLVVEIKYTKQVMGLFFKVVSLNNDIQSIKQESVDNSNILEHIHSLGIEKVTDRLFIQKDIRGFEENGFYIVKPNEYKLWHKAIAHIDANEFMDAILVAGNKGNNYVS
jgi:hypothetical protein